MPAGVAERVAELLAPPESLDPEDADALGDGTVAGKRRRGVPAELSAAAADVAAAPSDKRLRLRAGVPVLSKYKGRKVSRKEAFGEDEEGADAGVPASDDDVSVADEAEETLSMPLAAAGGFSISGELEAEYDKMMKEASKELEVMRAPSAGEVARRTEEAKRLKRLLDAWNALLEFRIHLEGALSIGHRLPVAMAAQAFQQADPGVGVAADTAAQELQGLLGELLALQGRLAEQPDLRSGLEEAAAEAPAGEGEARAWATVDARLRQVLDWGLGTADEWKERTRLDARRSFKVLDQSLRVQMQAVAEVPPEKLRRRCAPPPGRHKVFGISTLAVPAEAAEGGGEAPGGEADIFDDRDFYVQLLREVLGGGGAAGAKPGGLQADEARDLQAELQGRRAAKKRQRAEVERRASKGRKIRYVPIEKLQNFMAPRPRAASAAGADTPDAVWEGAAEALLRSLFAPPMPGAGFV